MTALLLGGIFEEGADSGEFAGGRRSAEPLPSPVGEEGAQVGGTKAKQRRIGDRLAAIAAEEIDQPMRCRNIGAHRMRGAAAVMLQIGSPLRGECAGGVVG
jgi:hypothetical protein